MCTVQVPVLYTNERRDRMFSLTTDEQVWQRRITFFYYMYPRVRTRYPGTIYFFLSHRGTVNYFTNVRIPGTCTTRIPFSLASQSPCHLFSLIPRRPNRPLPIPRRRRVFSTNSTIWSFESSISFSPRVPFRCLPTKR